MRRLKGFSLIELMVSLLMAGLLTLVMGNVFIANQVARDSQESLSEVQNNGRVAMMWLQHDLRMAGNISKTYSRSPIKQTDVVSLAPAIVNNCFTTGTQAFDWGLAIIPLPTGDPAPMIYGVDNVATTNDVFGGCIDGDDLQPGSDIISVHFSDANQIADAALVDGNIYLNSGLGGTVVFQCDDDGTNCKDNLTDARDDPSGTSTHLLISRVYWVRSWADTDGDGMPTLMRNTLQPDGTVVEEKLIEGVASLQVTYGLDTNNNGNANRYQTAAGIPALNTVAGVIAWSKVKSVKFALLMQSTTADQNRDPANDTYDVGGTDVQISGSFLGKVFSTTVAVRNPTIRLAS